MLGQPAKYYCFSWKDLGHYRKVEFRMGLQGLTQKPFRKGLGWTLDKIENFSEESYECLNRRISRTFTQLRNRTVVYAQKEPAF